MPLDRGIPKQEPDDEYAVLVQITDLIRAVLNAYRHGYIDGLLAEVADNDPEAFDLMQPDKEIANDDASELPTTMWIHAFADAIEAATMRSDGSTPLPEMEDLLATVADKLKASPESSIAP